MRTIVVTGALGTLGKPLVAFLKKNPDNEVWGIDLYHTNQKKYFRADVGSYRQLESALKDIKLLSQNNRIDFIYHLAAEFGRMNGEQYYEQLWKTNAIGTKNILALQQLELFDKLIFFSSSEVYGDIKEPVLKESLTDERGIIHHNDYAMTKWVNEQQILNHIVLNKKPVMRVRLFNAYGPYEYYHPYRSVICLFCYRALHDMPYQVYLNYHRVFMYIDDLIPTLSKIVSNFIPGEVINIGGTEYREVKEASDLILQYLNKTDKNIMYLPEEKHNVTNKNPDITKARKLLGHNPQITLEQGIPQTLEWMKRIYGV